jgi:hypothetical protein
MVLSKKYVVVFAIVAITVSLLYFSFDPASSNFFPKCIFHSLTQLECPGCGSQRAIYALLHGNILQAADLNLLVVIFLPLLCYSGIITMGNTLFDRKWKQPIFYSNHFVKIVLTLVLLFWLLRNIPLNSFRWLSAGS